MKSLVQHLLFLKDEIECLKKQTGGSGKGSIFTAINVLERRLEEISEQIEKNV